MPEKKQLSQIVSTVPTNAIAGSHCDDRSAPVPHSQGEQIMKNVSEPITRTNGDSVMQTAPEVSKVIEDESPIYEQKSDLAEPSVISSDDDLDDDDFDEDDWDDDDCDEDDCDEDDCEDDDSDCIFHDLTVMEDSDFLSFINAIYSQSFFNPDLGDIILVQYARRVEVCGNTAAIKYAYFYAFCQRRQFMADGKQASRLNGYPNVFWVLADDLVFALDFSNPKSFKPQDGDEISFDFGGGVRKVALPKTTEYETADGRIFINFFTD